MQYKNAYKEKGVIGRGNFGVATLVNEKSTGIDYIAKKISLSSLSEYELKSCQLEAKLLESLNHPSIVQYKDSFVEPGQLIIIMEYCPGGDLSQLIKSHKQINSYFPESQISEWMYQMLSALDYLDSNRVIHRDIKSSNVYITLNGDLKLGDFGIAKLLNFTAEVAQTVVGTPYYMSPEVCENKPYTSKCDIWSLGCLFYEITALKHPFTGNSFLALVMNILKESPQPLSQNYSEGLIGTIMKMLTKDMKLRPSAANILKSQYFDGSSKETSEKSEESLEEYQFDVSLSSDEVMLGSRNDCFGISGINPLELLNTDRFEGSLATDYNYSITIPMFTPDVQMHDIKVFQCEGTLRGSLKVLKTTAKSEEDEYEDDFESVKLI